VPVARRSLSLPEQVEAMVNYIVDAPAEDASDKLKFVYPYKVAPHPSGCPWIVICVQTRARPNAGFRHARFRV